MHAHAPGPGASSRTAVSSVHGNAALSDSEAPVLIRHHSQGALLGAPPRPQETVEVEEDVVEEVPPPPPPPFSIYSLGPAPAAPPQPTTRTVRRRRTVTRARAGPVVGKVHFALPPLRDPRPPRATRSGGHGGNGRGEEEEEEEGCGGGGGGSGPAADDVVVSTALEVAASPYFGRQRLRPQSADQNTVGGDSGGDMYFSLPAHGPTKIIRVELYAGRTLVGARARGGSQSLPADRDFRLHIASDMYGEGEGQRLVESSQGLGVTLTVEFLGEDDGEEGLLISSVALVQTYYVEGAGPAVDAV